MYENETKNHDMNENTEKRKGGWELQCSTLLHYASSNSTSLHYVVLRYEKHILHMLRSVV